MSQPSQQSNADAGEQEEEVMSGPKVVEALQVCGHNVLAVVANQLATAIRDLSTRLREA